MALDSGVIKSDFDIVLQCIVHKLTMKINSQRTQSINNVTRSKNKAINRKDS